MLYEFIMELPYFTKVCIVIICLLSMYLTIQYLFLTGEPII